MNLRNVAQRRPIRAAALIVLALTAGLVVGSLEASGQSGTVNCNALPGLITAARHVAYDPIADEVTLTWEPGNNGNGNNGNGNNGNGNNGNGNNGNGNNGNGNNGVRTAIVSLDNCNNERGREYIESVRRLYSSIEIGDCNSLFARFERASAQTGRTTGKVLLLPEDFDPEAPPVDRRDLVREFDFDLAAQAIAECDAKYLD